MTELHCKCL